jgi:hypothetical protein
MTIKEVKEGWDMATGTNTMTMYSTRAKEQETGREVEEVVWVKDMLSRV